MEVLDVPQHPIFGLRAIYIRRSEVSLSDDFDPLLPGQTMRGKFRITEGTSKVEQVEALTGDRKVYSSCAITTKFDFQYIGALPATAPDQTVDGNSVLASISAEITAHYSIPEDKLPTDEMVARWHGSTVIGHCWPYWREYCQNTMLRMNLPVMIMPMISPHRINIDLQDEKKRSKKKEIAKKIPSPRKQTASKKS
jgi:hypothetical protein